MSTYTPAWEIDLGAERMIAAQREAENISVELKRFRTPSFAHEFHSVLGQYLKSSFWLKAFRG